MKILFITPYFAPAWSYGGPPRVLFELAKFLVTGGHSVTVYTTNVNDKDTVQPEFKVSLENIEILYFPNISNKLAYYGKLFIPLGFKQHLQENINAFDIALMSDVRSLLNAYAAPILSKNNVPYVHIAYGCLPMAGGIFTSLLKFLYDRMFLRTTLNNAAALIGQTYHEQLEYDKVVKGLLSKTHLVPLATDLGQGTITDPHKEQAFRTKYAIAPHDFVITSLGRIHELKITALMVETIAHLVKNKHEQIPHVKWLLIGRDDGYLKTIQQLVKNYGLDHHFIFTGPLYHQEKLIAYGCSDVFFLAPSHFEETSTACLEALACGVPCVISEQCDVPYLQEYNAGIVTDFDKGNLADALEKIAGQGKKSFADNCQRLIDDHFTWQQVGAKTEKIFEDILHLSPQ